MGRPGRSFCAYSLRATVQRIAAARGSSALANVAFAARALSANLQSSSLGSALQPIRRDCQALEDAVRRAEAEITGQVWLNNRQEWLQTNDVVISRIIDRLAEIR